MKIWALIFLLAGTGCASMKPEADPKSLAIAKAPLEVVQQTENKRERRSNVLYLPNRPVNESEFGTPQLKNLVEEMHQTMVAKSGVGIAANQVGKNIQIFMIEARSDNPRYKVLGAVPLTVFINPRIVRASAEKNNFWHGCLSAVGKKRGNVATYDWIEVEGRDPDGHSIQTRLHGLAAVIFQHEFRHMLGGTYLDKAKEYVEKEELDMKVQAKELAFFAPASDDLPVLIDDYKIGETLEDFYRRTRE